MTSTVAANIVGQELVDDWAGCAKISHSSRLSAWIGGQAAHKKYSEQDCLAIIDACNATQTGVRIDAPAFWAEYVNRGGIIAKT